jgi:aldose 1-epimerase
MRRTIGRALCGGVAAGLAAASVALAAGAGGEPYGKTKEGEDVTIYTLGNAAGMRARILDYGGTVVSLEVPDREGKLADVVLGFSKLEDYLARSPYFGCIVGRYGNRIAAGRFTLDGREYKLATNNEPGGMPCALHGGLKGFDKVVWKAERVSKPEAEGLKLRYVSKDGEEGYPGNLDVTVTYWVTADNALMIFYSAATDKKTPVNLTHHGYFNLKGEGNGDILGHELRLLAANFTPVNKGLIPTGEIRPVQGTPFDFTAPHAIGERIGADDEQLRFGGGYDHNWVLDAQEGGLALAATVYEPGSGRVMEVSTTEPGIQFYCGNFLDGTLTGKSGKPYPHRSGFCLETQHYPDSPNQPGFPSTILEPGKTYRSQTVYRFTVKK